MLFTVKLIKHEAAFAEEYRRRDIMPFIFVEPDDKMDVKVCVKTVERGCWHMSLS